MGDFSLGSCSMTCGSTKEAWWAVDLQATYQIRKVVIANREDCCGQSKAVSDFPIIGKNVSLLVGKVEENAFILKMSKNKLPNFILFSSEHPDFSLN